MVDVLVSSENVSVLGGPAEVSLSLDLGSPGPRGSNIFTGNGKPTDPDSGLPSDIKAFDLYINIKPSDDEYLFLYQYGSVNGVLAWTRVIRLIPNTAIANVPVLFLNGQAVNEITGQPLPGLLFPLGEFFNLEDLGSLSASNFNVQYNLQNINDEELFDLDENPLLDDIQNPPMSTGLTVGPVTEFFGQIFLPVLISAVEYVQVAEDPMTQMPTFNWVPVHDKVKLLSFALTANIGTIEQPIGQS
jgi:hypothetical protein